MTTQKPSKTFSRRTVYVGYILGGIIGAVLATLVIFMVMPSMMIITEQSSMSFDETVKNLQKSITENGWVVSGVRDINKSLAKQNVKLKKRVKLIELRKPEYAKSVLETDTQVSTMMPCTFSVWEEDNGTVNISRVNMKLMAKMFGGNVEDVMGKKVVKDEHKILDEIIKD